jgi:predicted alpha/beta-hydrolase family hydrolase
VATAFLITEPANAPRLRFLCAHGAGAGMRTPFLTRFATLAAERGIATHRFTFSFMAEERRRPPRAESLVAEYRAAVAALPADVPLLIGGKSMGGRVASLLADSLHACGRIAGLVCLGYPLHPPKQPERLRMQHLVALACPALIVQGERDPFGTRAEFETLTLSPSIRFAWMPDGDHDFRARRAFRVPHHDNLAAAADAVAAFGDLLRTA